MTVSSPAPGVLSSAPGVLPDWIDARYAAFVRGKHVALVGPARSVVGTRQRERIEQADLVVRMNKALPVPSAIRDDVGERCDVLYHCEVERGDCGGPLNADVMRRAGVQWLCSPHNRSIENAYGCGREMWRKYTEPFRRFARDHGFPCHLPHKEFYRRLCEHVGHPNTGTSAIVDLLAHGAAVVYVTGVTMMRGGYVRQYRDLDERQSMEHVAKFSGHDVERQRVYLKDVLASDERFQPDDALRCVLEAA